MHPFELLERVTVVAVAYARRKRALRALSRRERLSAASRRAIFWRLHETNRLHRQARARAVMVGHAVSTYVCSRGEV